jgi:hypothetical protein
MKVLLIIIIVYGVLTTISILGMFYDWLRYDSGLFKPQYHVAHCVRKMRQYKDEMNECAKNDDLQQLVACADSLDYWRSELRRSIRYYRRHKTKWAKIA